MLTELYEYAQKRNLVIPPGFERKKIKAYVCLNKLGEFTSIEPGPVLPVLCPDMGSTAQSPYKCNVLVEKRAVTLEEDKPKKHPFYMAALADGGTQIPELEILRQTLLDETAVSKIREELDKSKIKAGDRIGFRVNDIPLESLVSDWWPTFLKKQREGRPPQKNRPCFVTGKLAPPMRTVPKIHGLLGVGGHTSGDALISFAQDSFCSYGFVQGENASVSEEGIAAVNAALTHLIARAKTLCGVKWVHWYQEPLAPNQSDILGLLFETSQTDESPQDSSTDFSADADRLLMSPLSGEKAPSLQDNTYYIMPLSGASGRIRVQGWQQGNYRELVSAMDAWWDDLSLYGPYQEGLLRNPSLGKINLRLLEVKKADRPVNERTHSELAGLESSLLFSILNNNPLPDLVAVKALRYIQSMLYRQKEEIGTRKFPILDPVACQLLKAWLIRKNRFCNKGAEFMMQESLYRDCPSVAYQCGRMLAVYGAIQFRAMGSDLGVTVVHGFYHSASTTPAMVFGQLSDMCQFYLAKLRTTGSAEYFLRLLGEISEKIGVTFPATLSMQQQAEFALGYYQQRANLLKKKTD